MMMDYDNNEKYHFEKNVIIKQFDLKNSTFNLNFKLYFPYLHMTIIAFYPLDLVNHSYPGTTKASMSTKSMFHQYSVRVSHCRSWIQDLVRTHETIWRKTMVTHHLRRWHYGILTTQDYLLVLLLYILKKKSK